MESIKIPTAEEFIGMNYSNNHKEGKTIDFSTCVDKMKSYAKLHVEAALKAVHREHQLPPEDLEFTLNAYSMDNIK